MHADMGGAIECRTRRQRIVWHSVELAAELLLDEREHLVDAHASMTYLSRALLRSVRSPWSMKTRTMASATLVASAGLTTTPVSCAKSLWPVMPPIIRRNHTPGSTPKPSFTSTAWKPMSLVSSSTGMMPPPSKRDIELARQAVERALVEDVEMPFAGVGPSVEQLLRVDAGGRRAGDVADVVGAGAARAEPEILDRLDHGDGVLGLDLADLQIGAGGDVGVAAAVALGEVGDAGELPMREDAVRHPQPAHVGVLVRRHVEQAEEAPAEIVGRLGIFVVRGLRLQPLVAVEGVLLALEFLLLGELAAGLEDAVLRPQMLGIGPGRLRRTRPSCRSRRAAIVPRGLAICRPATNPSR